MQPAYRICIVDICTAPRRSSGSAREYTTNRLHHHASDLSKSPAAVHNICTATDTTITTSTSEYLLCGIPVVSTPSRGGRDTWFNIDNSIIVEPNPGAVREGVTYIIEKNLTASVIRENHIRMTKVFRNRFVDHIQKTLDIYNIKDITANQYFKDNFFHKMRESENIKDVIKIFNGK